MIFSPSSKSTLFKVALPFLIGTTDSLPFTETAISPVAFSGTEITIESSFTSTPIIISVLFLISGAGTS